MKINLRIWRQRNSKDQGRLVEYTLDGVSGDMSFLEMLDMLNGRPRRERAGDPPPMVAG